MRIILIFLLISSYSFASAPVKQTSRWHQLMQLVSQEMRILESAKKKGADLKYRMLELHSERLKLIHEKNNREFMAKGNAKNKEMFFAETRAYYNKTKAYGHQLLKEYPKTAHRPWIFFALGLNSRDYGTDKIAEKYLLTTISLVRDPHSSLRHHAQTALADHYYNQKRYQDAINYYERAIKNKDDEWLTKHLFNLSWCYLKVREFDKAIATIKDSYFTSKNKVYINMRDQVLENIGSFHVYASRPLEGLEFYLDNEKDPIPYLMPMGLKAMDKGHEKETEKILAAVQKLINKNDWEKYQEQLYLTYLDFYRHYNRFDDHEKVSAKLVTYYGRAESKKGKDLKLPVELKEDAVEKMRSLAGFLQVSLMKNLKKESGSYSHKDMNIVLNFFQHLITLDPAKKGEYYYYRAETFYSVRRYKDAAPAYVEAIKEADFMKNKVQARKALNSLLALTGMEVIPAEENKQYLIFAYSSHVKIWPRDEKSEQIYPKLFEIYRQAHDDVQATQVLKVFNQHYPEHLKAQQGLMTKVLDQFIDKKDTKKLAFWVDEFKTGFLSFSKATIEKTEIVLGNILFLQYQDVAKKGDKLAAAKGFEQIYVNKLYPDKVKYQSAFFAAKAYLELGETVKSYYWLELAHARMTKQEMLERRGEELKITERTYRLQDFVTAYKMTQRHLGKYCSLKDDIQNRFFEIAVMTSLVEEKVSDAEEVVKKYSKCINKTEIAANSLGQIYQFIEKQGDFYELRKFVKRHPVEPYITQYRYSLQKWYWEKSNLSLKDRILQEFKQLKHEETLVWLNEIKLFEKALTEHKKLISYVIWDKPVFDGDAYNKALEGYLLELQKFKDRYSDLTKSSQVDLAILSTKLFAGTYLKVGENIQSVNPKGLDPEIVNDFKKAMKQVSAQFLKTAAQYERNLAKALNDKETITYGSRSIASVDDVENPVNSSFTGLTMDKGRE